MAKDEPYAKRRGWLKNGNPAGDPSTAPRCGARTRKGAACKGPAMQTDDVGCTAALALGPALRSARPVRCEQTGNTADTQRKPTVRRDCCASCFASVANSAGALRHCANEVRLSAGLS